MLKISYMSDWNNQTGTHYTQRIRATGQEMSKIAECLQKAYEDIQNIKNTKNIYTSEEMKKICYQKCLHETPQEVLSNGKLKFYLNLTQLETILHNIKYILSNNGKMSASAFQNAYRLHFRNTILIFGGQE